MNSEKDFILELQHALPNNIIISQEFDYIVITGPNHQNGNYKYSIKTLKNPIWNKIKCKQIVLRNFFINKTDVSIGGDIFCALFMAEKYGYECIKDCILILPTHISNKYIYDGQAIYLLNNPKYKKILESVKHML